MTKTVFAEMETTGVLMEESASTRTNSPAGRVRWVLPGRERPQQGTMTAESVLTAPSNSFIIIVDNLSAVVASGSIWEISDKFGWLQAMGLDGYTSAQ